MCCRAADRCVRGCQHPGPGPVLPATPFAGALLRQSAILARLTIQDAPFGGGPVTLRPAQRPRTTSPVAPRHAASGHYSWLTLTPRSEPRAELRHPCPPRAPHHVRNQKWLRLPAHNWLCFGARSHLEQFRCTPGNGRFRSPLPVYRSYSKRATIKQARRLTEDEPIQNLGKAAERGRPRQPARVRRTRKIGPSWVSDRYGSGLGLPSKNELSRKKPMSRSRIQLMCVKTHFRWGPPGAYPQSFQGFSFASLSWSFFQEARCHAKLPA
jgi:hypothetical protein